VTDDLAEISARWPAIAKCFQSQKAYEVARGMLSGADGIGWKLIGEFGREADDLASVTQSLNGKTTRFGCFSRFGFLAAPTLCIFGIRPRQQDRRLPSGGGRPIFWGVPMVAARPATSNVSARS
jgi:hypothetical protein